MSTITANLQRDGYNVIYGGPNIPSELETIVCHCLVHARRQFMEIMENFPEECAYVIEQLAIAYRHEAFTRQQAMSPEDRLAYHRSHSAPVMEELKNWCLAKQQNREVEPNSELGKAIQYLLKHWKELSRFCHVPGAPLDNNVCERALKHAVLHRKNAYFFKTPKGAHVGDLFMSLIHTCELAGESPMDVKKPSAPCSQHPSHVRRRCTQQSFFPRALAERTRKFTVRSLQWKSTPLLLH